MLFQALTEDQKLFVLKRLREYVSKYNKEIIDSRNSKVSYLFNEAGFDKMNQKLIAGESFNFKTFKQEN